MVTLHFTRGTAMAEGISGSVELLESTTDSKSTDVSGLSTSTKANSFFQRYQLFYAETLFPYVNLRAGSSFDKMITEAKDPAGNTRSTNTNIFPSADLTLNNPFVSSGVGYSKREEKVEASGVSPVTNIMESKNAFLGFRPEGLPTLTMQFTRTHVFDKMHEASDIENDLFSATTRFTPVKNLDLAYSVTSNDSKDRLSGVEFVSVSQNGRAGYNNRFFDNRVSFSTNYSGSRSTQETHSGNGGEVSFQLFPFTGLSNISDTPTLDALSPNQALIDGNLTASSGINIGQGVSFGGDTRLRSLGLDFVNATGANMLFIYVDRQLPAVAANAFAWDIYVSPDNQNWTPYQTNLHATFNPFSNRFELLFPDVTTRYIKAAVRPLSVAVLSSPGADVSNIYITELQSFIRRPSAQVAGKTESTSQFYDVNVRTALLENRSIYYTIYYSQANSNAGSSTSFLSNALSTSRQFSPVFSGAARVARDDSRDVSGSRIAYTGTASLMAVPLPTINNSLVLSVRRDDTNGQISSSESVFLSNSAALYRGFDVNVSGGVNFTSPVTGAKTESTIINAGASIVPNKSLSMSVNHSETESSPPGGTQNGVNRARSTSGNVSWAPFTTIYLAYSISEVSATNTQSQTIQNYSASWSPFSSGTLNFSCGYSETLQSLGTGIDRALSVGMEWRAGPRIYLTAGYVVAKSTVASQSTDATSLSTDLRMSF